VKKTCLFLLIATIAWENLYCESYPISTNNKNITCKLSQWIKSTCRMKPEETAIFLERDTPRFNKTVWENFSKFKNNFVILKVEITNNSSDTLYITPKEYIEGVKDLVIPKHKFLYFYTIEKTYLTSYLFVLSALREKREIKEKYDAIAKSANKRKIGSNDILKYYSEKTFLFKLEPGSVLEDYLFTTNKDLDEILFKIDKLELTYSFEP
jgi:hypothetical protein